MVNCSTGLTVKQTLGFEALNGAENRPESYTIRLSRPEIALVTRHEADLGIPTRGGLFVPRTSADHNRWFGVVVAVGERWNKRTKRWESCAPDLQFGDLVELSRWTGSMWQKYPLATMFSQVGKGSKVLIRNPDPSRGEAVEMTWTDQFAVQSPEHIACKIADGDWMLHKTGREPGAYPVGDRVFVRFEKKRASEVLEVIDWSRPQTIEGDVLKVGGTVTSVMPGDRIIAAPTRYSLIENTGGEDIYSIREGDILCRS